MGRPLVAKEHRWPVTILVSVLLLAGAAVGVAHATEWEHIERDLGREPIYLTGSLSLGGSVVHDFMSPGFGVAFVMRPAAADRFLRQLYNWNVGLALQAEYRGIASGRRLLAGEMVLRRYAQDMRSHAALQSTYLGFGFGASEVTFPIEDASASEIWFCLVFEAGHEWTPRPDLLMQVKAQYRFFRHHDLDYSGWSFHGGIGVPIPW